MPKVTIEMDDDLDERVQDCIDELKEMIMEHLEQNAPGASKPDGIDDITEPGELVDNYVPCMTKQQADLFYLHDYELKQAFDDAGFGGDFEIPLAIYAYITQEVNDWFHRNIDEIFEEFEVSGRNTFKIGDDAIWINPETEKETRVTIQGFFQDRNGDHVIGVYSPTDNPVIPVSDIFIVKVNDLRELTYQEILAND